MKIASIHNSQYKYITRQNKLNVYKNPISFSSKPKTLAQKFGIDVNDVEILSSCGINLSQDEKAMLIEKILEAHILAKKNCEYGNIVNVGYATNVGLENGTWHCATNFNNTRNNISAVCGERSAVLGAYNDALKSKPEYMAGIAPLDFKVKYLAMSSYKEIGTDKNADSPCAECLSWLNTTRYFSNDTIIATLQKDESGKIYLKLSTLKERLPYRDEINEAKNVNVQSLGIKTTSNAARAMEEKGITRDKIREFLLKLSEIYNSNTLAQISTQNIAAGVFANGEFFSAPKIDFSKRWFAEPIMQASFKAIEKYQNDTRIDLIACFGDSTIKDKNGIVHNDGIISLKTLGELNIKYANPDTLVVTSTDKAIFVRTISDYMPDKFKYHQVYKIN